MYIRTFFFIIFIVSSVVFFISYYNPIFILNICGATCENRPNINYIEIMSILIATFSILIFAIANYYTEKKILAERKRLEIERQNIEEIHAELQALLN